jgi:hypothetical protein
VSTHHAEKPKASRPTLFRRLAVHGPLFLFQKEEGGGGRNERKCHQKEGGGGKWQRRAEGKAIKKEAE